MRMSFTMHGIGASDGIAIGPAHLVSYATLEAAQYLVPAGELANERQRFATALARVRDELTQLRGSIPAAAPAEFGAFIDVHQMILADSTLSQGPLDLIDSQQCNAEWALKLQLDLLLDQFDAIDDPYLRERKGDILQVVERVMKVLVGKPGYIPRAAPGSARAILVAHDLSPADMIQFKQLPFAGFLTDLGGSTSHTAIVARSLSIPAIVALHRARALIRENDQLIIDGTLGVVIVNPDPAVLSEYRLRQEALGIERAKLQRLATRPASTIDGTSIELLGNIEGPDDVADVRLNGGMGVGLFRTEFLFMNRDELPDEDEQFEAYRADGFLTRLDLAWSRDQGPKVYVQHLLAQQGAEVWAWLNEGGHFYVCGDAVKMAKDVDDALHALIATHGGMSEDAAAEYVKKMKKDKRYQRDVY